MIRLAWIGQGDEVAVYAPTVERLRHAQFTAVAAPGSENAKQVAQQLGATVAASGIGELLDHHAAEFDAMVIHSLTDRDLRLVRRVAEAGKHLLIPLPMAAVLARAEDLMRCCEQANVRLMVGQTSRFLPTVQTVKQVLDTGKLGAPGLLRIHRWEPALRDDEGQGRGSAADGVDCSFAHLLRDIDLANWLFGELPTSIFAVSRRLAATSSQRPDYVQLHLGFHGGGMALLDFTSGLPMDDAYFSLSLIGSSGATYADDHHNMQLLMRGATPVALKTTPGKLHMLMQVQEFVNAIRENREAAVPAVAGRDAALVAEAADRSSRSATALRLTGDKYELA